jgi:hypothetical protein
MKKAVVHLKDTISDFPDLPTGFVEKINALEEDLRFISPTEKAEAHRLEEEFVAVIHALALGITHSVNGEALEDKLKKAERIYQNRKTVYSN